MAELGFLYEALLAPYLSSRTPSIPFYSTVLGKVIEGEGSLDAAYWRANLQSPVLFKTAIEMLLQEQKPSSTTVMVEVGPHSALAGPLRQMSKSAQAEVTYVPTL